MNKRAISKIIILNIIYPLAGILIFLLIWQIGSMGYGIKRILPTPLASIKRAGELLVDGDFWLRLGGSFVRNFWAFAISFTLALFLALLSESFVPLKRIVAPIMSIIRAVPTMVVIVLFLLWTNALITPILVVILVLFPTFYTSFTLVLSKTDKAIIDSMRVLGANKLDLMRYVHLPLLSKSLIESTASGLSLGFKLVVSAEILARTRNSIGQMMQLSQQNLEIDLLMGSAIIVCAVCILIELLLLLPLNKMRHM